MPFGLVKLCCSMRLLIQTTDGKEFTLIFILHEWKNLYLKKLMLYLPWLSQLIKLLSKQTAILE
ncbi:hypothetical protein C492_15021 [Natronococcus jeotgali DSM 18795]|uniref:Uncharacterized protein n=1 Tax=Natronococcus jeotgali DSM 18795 TaxID=1227498 RepID=L9X2E5_9EURY|nr:hypothetical protein C492_15021 [Natronococcus jeotgali DSM 18795]